MLEYPPEQLWPLYEKLPEELKEAIFSEKTADNIFNTCERNGIGEEQMGEIARYTGYVLLGVLLPSKFQETLEKEVKLDPEKAEKIALEIARFIFLPVKESLHTLSPEEIIVPKEAPEVISKAVPLPKKGKKPDIYREPIE